MSVNPALIPSGDETLAFNDLFEEYAGASAEELAVPESTDPIPATPFVIDDDSKANWALGKIRQLDLQLAKDQRFFDKEQLRLKHWLDQVKNRYKNYRAHLEFLLVRYYRQLKDDNPKLKTVKLPNGSFIERTATGSPFDYEEEAVLEWVRTNAPEFIKTKESLDWASLKNYLTRQGDRIIYRDTGEVVPGIWPTIQETRFYVKPSDD